MHQPAYSVEERGFLREGYWADIVIVNPSQNTSVQESELYSKCQWSPFPHMTFTNSIETTIVSGEITYQDGELNNACRGKRVNFSKLKDR